jgi:hypothetical protein
MDGKIYLADNIMKTFIILIPVVGSIHDPRKACENIENTCFEIEYPNERTVLEKVLFELGVEDDHLIEVHDISDFMDMLNNEEFIQEMYYMSYITTK